MRPRYQYSMEWDAWLYKWNKLFRVWVWEFQGHVIVKDGRVL